MVPDSTTVICCFMNIISSVMSYVKLVGLHNESGIAMKMAILSLCALEEISTVCFTFNYVEALWQVTSTLKIPHVSKILHMLLLQLSLSFD